MGIVTKIYEDLTGKTAANIGADQARTISQAGQQAQNAYTQQYGIGATQTLPMTAAYQSLNFGIPLEATPAYQEYKRLNPNAFIDKQALQKQIADLQDRLDPAKRSQYIKNYLQSSGKLGMGGSGILKSLASDTQQLTSLQKQLQDAQNSTNPFTGGLFDNLRQGNVQGALNAMPGYSATFNSGINALQNSAAGRGLQSSANQKAVMNFGQNLAQDFLMNQLGGYQGVAQQGANAINYGQGLGNMIYNPGVASAGALAAGQAAGLGQRQQLYGQIASAATGGLGGGSSYGGSSLNNPGSFGGRPGVGGGMGSFY